MPGARTAARVWIADRARVPDVVGHGELVTVEAGGEGLPLLLTFSSGVTGYTTIHAVSAPARR